MTHPDLQVAGQPLEQVSVFGDADARLAVLVTVALLDPALQELAHQLHAVADTQHGNTGFEDAGIAHRRAVLEDTGRAAGKDDTARLARRQVNRLRVEAEQLTVHVLLTHAPGNELAVLRAEIQNRYPVVVHVSKPGTLNLGPGRGVTIPERGYALFAGLVPLTHVPKTVSSPGLRFQVFLCAAPSDV